MHELEVKRKERKLKKAKEAQISLKTSNIEVNSNGNGDISTDEEELDRKLHVLIKRLESKLDNPSKSVAQKKSVKKVLDQVSNKVNSLHNKTKRMQEEWDRREPPKPKTNGVVKESSFNLFFSAPLKVKVKILKS